MKTIAAALTFAAACFAQQPPCTVAKVSGTYAFLANGSLLQPGTPIFGPFSRIGSFTADGKGGINVSTLALYAGINFGLENFSGTYTVTSDCAIDFHLAVPQPINANVEFKGQVSLDGADVAFMLVNSDDPTKPAISTVAGFGKSRQITGCSSATLNGAWRMEINGTINLPPIGTGTPYRQVGRFVNDGKGGLLATFVTSNNGVIASETGAGTYTVSSDCTFDLNYTIGTMPYSIHGSMIAYDQAFLALNLPGQAAPGIGVITGAVATGTLTREGGFKLSDLFHQ